MTLSPSTYLSLEAVQARTGRSLVLLRRWCRDKTIPAVKIAGEWMIAESLLAYIEELPRRCRNAPRTDREP